MALHLVEVKLHMVPYEGNIGHMYRDTKGLVTVGIGNLLASVEAAQALGFISRASTRSASAAQIKADYEFVQKQRVGLRAQGYREFTKLDLPDWAINDLFASESTSSQSSSKLPTRASMAIRRQHSSPCSIWPSILAPSA
jgi:hypothetical protein